MDIVKRKKVVLAMEMLAREINNEDFIDSWLMCGVADGDIPGFSIDIADVDDYYVEDDEVFAELMGTFLRVMSYAKKDGGLYVDNVASK